MEEHEEKPYERECADCGKIYRLSFESLADSPAGSGQDICNECFSERLLGPGWKERLGPGRAVRPSIVHPPDEGTVMTPCHDCGMPFPISRKLADLVGADNSHVLCEVCAVARMRENVRLVEELGLTEELNRMAEDFCRRQEEAGEDPGDEEPS